MGCAAISDWLLVIGGNTTVQCICARTAYATRTVNPRLVACYIITHFSKGGWYGMVICLDSQLFCLILVQLGSMPWSRVKSNLG